MFAGARDGSGPAPAVEVFGILSVRRLSFPPSVSRLSVVLGLERRRRRRRRTTVLL